MFRIPTPIKFMGYLESILTDTRLSFKLKKGGDYGRICTDPQKLDHKI